MFSKNNTGVLGIEYELVLGIEHQQERRRLDDWTIFVKKKSDGLTKTGQKLFQLAVESYVYAVLGAQAQTRWPIVGRGAKSLQTQQNFSQIGKRHRHPGRPGEGGGGHEVGHKRHDRGPEHVNFTRTDARSLGPDHSQRKCGGLQQRSHARDEGHEVRLERGRELRETQTRITDGEKSSPSGGTQEEKSSPVGGAPKIGTSLLPRPDETPYLLGSAVTLGFLMARYMI